MAARAEVTQSFYCIFVYFQFGPLSCPVQKLVMKYQGFIIFQAQVNQLLEQSMCAQVKSNK